MKAAAAELSQAGKVESAAVDLYDDSVTSFIERIAGESRPIKYLLNAPGYFSPLPFLDHQSNDYDRYMKINRGVFFVTQAVAKNMREHKTGSIVNIGSMWAKQAVKATPSSAYSMAKAGLHSLTQHLAMELADYGIRVNAVSPAVVETPIYGAFIEPTQIHSILKGFDGFHPIGRIGQPADVASVIRFLFRMNPPGSQAPSGMSTVASWQGGTESLCGTVEPRFAPFAVRKEAGRVTTRRCR